MRRRRQACPPSRFEPDSRCRARRSPTPASCDSTESNSSSRTRWIGQRSAESRRRSKAWTQTTVRNSSERPRAPRPQGDDVSFTRPGGEHRPEAGPECELSGADDARRVLRTVYRAAEALRVSRCRSASALCGRCVEARRRQRRTRSTRIDGHRARRTDNIEEPSLGDAVAGFARRTERVLEQAGMSFTQYRIL